MLNVSVIITNYNQGHLIKEAIKSVYKQTALPLELVIVDDGSTDNSVQMIETILAETPNKVPTRLIVHEENKGLPSARNTGIDNTVGSIVANLDSDDFYYADKISRSLEIFDRYPEVGAVYTDYDEWDVRDPKNKKVRREFKYPYDAELLWQFCMISTNSLIRREVFNTTGKYDPEVKVAEDYEFWLRMAQQWIAMHIPESLFCYRTHGSNITLNRVEEMQKNEREFKERLWRLFNPKS